MLHPAGTTKEMTILLRLVAWTATTRSGSHPATAPAVTPQALSTLEISPAAARRCGHGLCSWLADVRWVIRVPQTSVKLSTLRTELRFDGGIGWASVQRETAPI